MTFIIHGTDGLTFNDNSTQNVTALNASNINAGTLGKARLPTGSVLQVVNATTNTETSNATSTYADTTLTATITPTSATSKILVLVDQNGCGKVTNDTNVQLRLVRNGTALFFIDSAVANTNTSGVSNIVGSASCNYLDSPATTSALTYKTQFASRQNNNLAYVQYGYNTATTSTITLMEIAA
jgi:hypothetical protein